MEEYYAELKTIARSALNKLVATNKIGMLMIGRPYHLSSKGKKPIGLKRTSNSSGGLPSILEKSMSQLMKDKN